MKNLNVEELVKQGARVEIKFHECINLQEAYQKLKPFAHLGKIERGNYHDTYWLFIKKGEVSITAFYENQTKK